jgi:hypothetical protein
VQPSSPTAPAQGAELDYVVKVTSASVGGSSDVRLDLKLPDGYALSRTYADRGPGCTGTPPTLTCDVAWINPSSTTTVVIFGTVGQAGAQTLTATVTSMLEPELNPADNTVTVTLAAPAPPTPPPSAGVAGTTKTIAQATLLKAPSILGAHRVGATLRATKPLWSGRATNLRYAWQACTRTACAGIPGQHAPTLRLGRGAAGLWIRVAETATVRGTRMTAYSAKTRVSAR